VLYGEEGTWAYECRDLFTCGDPSLYDLVGIDAKGIQIRILLNYAYSDEAFKLYTTGDPHVNNATLLGLANKAAAKKFFYTLIMGGQGARLAADQAQFGTRLTAADGDKMKEMMIDTIPGFKDLIERLQKELNNSGRITLCDGTPILVPSPHMVIPYLLQGDESRIMKLAMRYIDEGIRRQKLEAWKVADIHDEGQYVSSIRDTQGFVDMALPVFPRVGEFFKYVVPIEGSAKVGKTWAETH
jgi:DNA polymerase-1